MFLVLRRMGLSAVVVGCFNFSEGGVPEIVPALSGENWVFREFIEGGGFDGAGEGGVVMLSCYPRRRSIFPGSLQLLPWVNVFLMEACRFKFRVRFGMGDMMACLFYKETE